MTTAAAGALLGLAAGLGLMLVSAHLLVGRRPSLEARVAPYVRDLPGLGAVLGAGSDRSSWSGTDDGWASLLGPTLDRAGRRLGSLIGGAASVRQRLTRAGSLSSVQDFRIEQVVWGSIGFAAVATVGSLATLRGRGEPGSWFLLCLFAAVFGVMARDYHLGSVVRRREQQMMAEFPTIADLLALSVAAGEGPIAALDRVVRVCRGELSRELAVVLAESRTGVPVAAALHGLAHRTGLPVVARFAEGFAIAVERGTPLADVLHAQAADVRDAGRRALIEIGARKEVLMMVPVVFLVLPVTVVFAFWPGVVGLSLVAP